MHLVCSILGNHLYLRAGEAPARSVVSVGNDVHILNRVFTRRNDRGAAPHGAYRADPVHTDAVGLILATIAADLRRILCFENAVACA